jgi:hypothetical protein
MQRTRAITYTPIMKDQPTQKTKKGHEIPVPKRGEVMRDLKKLAKASPPRRSAK